MKKLISLLAITLCCSLGQASYAQNIEGQIIASQFGAYQVPGIATGSLSFSPASCQVSGGNKNFEAFATGVPVKIVDANPNLTEVGTPSSVNITGCSISMATTYIHTTPFYATSGTGGLQEALTSGPNKQGGPNTVILNADWYTQVAPSNPATVIAAVKGSTKLGLVDVTTTPYTVYAWNGTNYAVVSYGAGNLPGGTGIVKVNGGTGGLATAGTDYALPNANTTGTAANLSGTPALPNGTTATTGSVGDNNNLLATNAQVYASKTASIPNTSSVLKGNAVAGQAVAATPGTDYLAPGLLPSATTAATAATQDTSAKVANDKWVSTNAMPAVTPQTFGGFGNAILIPNGCNTTASSSTVTCPSATFVSGDAGVGKAIWIAGAGSGGGPAGVTIVGFTNSTTITVSAAAVASVTGARSVYGNDDTAAIQSCFNYSAAHQVACVLNSQTGYLQYSATLLMAQAPTTANGGMNVIGNAFQRGTNIYCEYNGDCLALQSGPVQGASMSNIEIWADATNASSRGIHLNAAVGSFGAGGLFNSVFNNVEVENTALECLWMDGGGGPSYTFNLPNQYVTFNNFSCNGPNQSHPANLIKLTGQNAQIQFNQGATNGTSQANYPNPMIYIGSVTLGTPQAVDFHGYTTEVGTKALYIDTGSSNIHYENGWIETIATPLFVNTNATGITFNGNHIANSGNTTAVAQFAGGNTASMRDNFVSGATTPAAFAICSNNNNTIDFGNSNSSSVTTTTSCGTAQIAPSTSTFTSTGGQTNFVNGSATTITTITAPQISPGKTLTLYAGSSPGITLGTGGNINFGGVPAPLYIPNGGSVTLTLFDLGPTWLVTSTTSGMGANVKVVNGVSYSTGYFGATVDVRVNACIADAMGLANGNYTGICDASGETGTQVTAAQITLGNSSGTPATLIVPAQGQWRGGMTDGTSSTIVQYGNTSILGKGPESGIGTQFVFGATATSNLAYVFKLIPLGSQLNYVHDSNFAIVNVNGGPYVGAVTSQGVGAYFQGSMYDSSTLDHIVVFDSLDAISAYMPNWCCGATMRNVSINGNYGSGVTPLVISGTSALNLETLSVVHPGVGKPAMQVTDSTFNVSNLNIHGLYIETSNSDTTTALIQLQGYGSVFIDHLTAKAEATSMSAPIITSTSTTNTGITVDGFTAVNGAGNWQLPVTVINNSSTGQLVKGDSTGSKSNLGFYTNTVMAGGSMQVGTGFGTSQLGTSSACETAFAVTTLSTSASFTNTGLNCLPASAVIDSVVYRVTSTITGAGITGFTIGDTITATRFCGTQSTLTAGTTGVCLAQAGTSNEVQASAGKISISTGSTPSAGAIRVIVYYHTWVPPTS